MEESIVDLCVVTLVAGIVGLVLTRERHLRRDNRREVRRFRALVANVSDDILTISSDGTITYMSPSTEQLLGIGASAAAAGLVDWSAIVERESLEEVRRAFAELTAVPGASVAIDVNARGADGRLHRLLGRATNLLHDPAVNGTVIVFRDVTEQVALEGELRHQALHDALTGLPNRILIHDRLEVLLRTASRRGTTIVALCIDLDNFKDVNDSLGHDHGDELLRAVAARLEAVTRQGDTVGRLGGDEFVILAEISDDSEAPTRLGARILETLSEPFELTTLPNYRLAAKGSIGVATSDGGGAQELLRNADIALHRAKAAGKNRQATFRPEMHRRACERLELSSELREALEREEFLLVYQPIIDLDHRDPEGFEALLRWNRPDHGVMFPGQFIELLEEAGWIDDVGRWILQQACRQGAAWQRRGMNLSVNVNASAIQLQSESFGDDISKALSDSGFDPKCLVIEITESVLMQNHADTVARLQELKSLGVRIALDDFGTGYSSFAYLQDLPVDILKIDRSFVAKLGVPGAPGNLVRALVSIARELGMTTTAEGIESEAQLLSLRDAGCNLGQGYWIAAPLCAEEILPFVSSWGSSRHSLGLPAAR